MYASLRRLGSAREVVEKEQTALKNRVTALMGGYFPEFFEVFKYPPEGKAAMKVLMEFPLPFQVASLGADGALEVIKKAAKAGIGLGKASGLVEAAGAPIGSKHAGSGAALEIPLMAGGLALANKSGPQLLARMGALLGECPYGGFMLAVKGLGVAAAGAITGGAGGLPRFASP